MSAEPIEAETDLCKCQHMRRSHSGKNEKKKCTARVFAGGADPMGQGKCDCTDFRLYEGDK